MSRSCFDDGQSSRDPDEGLNDSRGPSDVTGQYLDDSGISSKGGSGFARPRPAEPLRSDARRREFRAQGRTYRLRDSEIDTMADIGKFRVVDVQDLAWARYQDDEHRMRRDLRNLVRQGIAEVRTSHSKYSDREFAALTASGEGLLRKTGAVTQEQETYYGFVRPRELEHDADLYRVYQREAEKIEKDGGRPTRVVLDMELRRDTYRELATLPKLADGERERSRQTIAQEHGLKMIDHIVMLPDLRIEYQTQEGEYARVDLELVTAEYGMDRIAAKAGAGFSIYARAQDEGGVRRALQDSRLIRDIFAL